jgi:hypothetical protein
MPAAIRIKRRSSGGAAGAPSTLQQAELAFNETDSTMYIGIGTGGAGGSATSVIPVAGPGAFVDLSSSQSVSGVKNFTTSPTAPTVTPGDSTTKVATTAFVAAAVGNAGGSQAANTVYAGPTTGAASAPTFRALVSNDIPLIPSSKLSDLGLANGAASLDSGGKVLTSQLPASVLGSLKYKGTIAASGALPASPAIGDYYVISSAGTFTGSTHPLRTGDWITYDGGTLGDLGAAGWDYVDNSVAVSSVFGRTGSVVATSGDYNTDQVTEGTTNLYFTMARVLSSLLTGFVAGTNAVVAASDTVLQALQKLQGQVTARLVTTNNLSDLASASVARSNLGLGSIATQSAGAVAITGGTIDSVSISNSTVDGGVY